MRKVLFILATTLCLSLFGCGKDEAVVAFEEKANSLDKEITTSDMAKFMEVQDDYASLTDEQIEQIDESCIDIVLSAQEKLDDIANNDEYYNNAITALSKIYDSLPSLDGFSVNKITCSKFEVEEKDAVDYEHMISVHIDFNTINALGVSERRKCIFYIADTVDWDNGFMDTWYMYGDTEELYAEYLSLHNNSEPLELDIDFICQYALQ